MKLSKDAHYNAVYYEEDEEGFFIVSKLFNFYLCSRPYLHVSESSKREIKDSWFFVRWNKFKLGSLVDKECLTPLLLPRLTSSSDLYHLIDEDELGLYIWFHPFYLKINRTDWDSTKSKMSLESKFGISLKLK